MKDPYKKGQEDLLNNLKGKVKDLVESDNKLDIAVGLVDILTELKPIEAPDK